MILNQTHRENTKKQRLNVCKQKYSIINGIKYERTNNCINQDPKNSKTATTKNILLHLPNNKHYRPQPLADTLLPSLPSLSVLTQALGNLPVECVLQAEPDRDKGKHCQEEDKQGPAPGTQLGWSRARHGQEGSLMATSWSVRKIHLSNMPENM